MPDANKIKVFQDTGMKIFKSCILCRHGEIPGTAWGFCKNISHFFSHAKHGRMPGVAHAAMGCDDFEMIGKHTREMNEIGLYAQLIPYYDEEVEEVGVEGVEENTEEDQSSEPPVMSFNGEKPAADEPRRSHGLVALHERQRTAEEGASETAIQPEPPKAIQPQPKAAAPLVATEDTEAPPPPQTGENPEDE